MAEPEASVSATATRVAALAGADGARWFSANPDKAWAEKFFLAYTPIWMAAFGFYQRSRIGDRFGDVGNLVVVLAIFTPVWLGPALLYDARAAGLRWFETYWFKFNVWIFIFSAIGSYFLSEYFFDVMGMVYNYPHLHWSFDSALVGSGKQVVPIIMYPSAHYFFVTYHTTAVILLRRVRTSPLGRHPLAVALAVAAAAWFWAWAEIRLTTDPSIADQFRYEDMAWALRWGAVFYACYFIVSFPMVYRLDEDRKARWTVGRTAIDALAAGMLVFTLLDLVTRFVTGAPWGR
jgi:cycloeucalenol cycloisomerase